MNLLIKHIKGLVGVDESRRLRKLGGEMKQLRVIRNAYLYSEKGKIVSYGRMAEWTPKPVDRTIDASERFLFPTFIDSHTHLVWAGNREGEFVDRIRGLTYQQIAEKGGGILNSAKKLHSAAEDELFEAAKIRINNLIMMGTGALEIKSGYGLSLEGEVKMLRVIKRLNNHFPIPIKATFLGAHAIPQAFQNAREKYMDLILNEMIPYIAEEKLADYVDVFCEKGYFSVEETVRILEKAAVFGLKGKIHVNQFNAFGGVKAAVDHHAVSVDHLEEMNPEDFEALQGASTMPVALPGCSFFLGIPYTPAREIIDRGMGVAIASDYNPGSAPSGNLQLAIALACIRMKLTPEEAIHAATLNAAYALELSSRMGSISAGKDASFFITKPMPSYAYIPYAFGENHIERVFIKGLEWNSQN
jgi:imidazolonepropionase